MNKIQKRIYAERERQKESERFGQSSSKGIWKFQVNETNYARVFLVKYIYIYFRFLMYEILLRQLKLVSTIFIFAIKIRLLNNYRKCYLIYQKTPFVLEIFKFLYSFLGNCWFYRWNWLMINSNVYGIIMSLNWILKADSLISVEVMFWSWYLVNR